MSTTFSTLLTNTRSLFAVLALVSAGLAFVVIGETPVQAQNSVPTSLPTATVTRAALPDLSPACAKKQVRVVYAGYGENIQACR